MPKRFVLDTNAILDDPTSIVEGFEENTRIICGTVIQELDSKKTADGEVGYNARLAGRILDDLRHKGDLLQGVSTPSGGILIFEPDGVNQNNLPDGFSIDKADNKIISTCIHLNKDRSKPPVILVTSDILMRISAVACGVECQEFRKILVEDSEYTGYCDWDTDSSTIDALYRESRIVPDIKDVELLENEFVTLHCEQQSALSVYRRGHLELIPSQKLYGWVTPKNAMQTYAMWALKQPAEELPLVILEGPAGPGKTFLSLGAGLDGTYTTQHKNHKNQKYFKMMITRPIAESFNGKQGVGYLPGDLQEKLHYLYQNYYDNLAVLIRGGNKDEDEQEIQRQVDYLIDTGLIEVAALAFIRGRSIMNSYLICDEAQNATKMQIRDVVTRSGDGTKVVLAGDPSQIDVPTLSEKNNGLVMARETMAGSETTAYIRFPKQSSVRSALASEAIKRMVF